MASLDPVLTAEAFVEQLLALPDSAAQRQFLAVNLALLDDQVASALKAQADHLMRADSRQALQTAELLLYLAQLTAEPSHQALGLLAEANVRSIGLGQYLRAIELYEQAARIYQGQDRLVEQARSQIGKIGALANLGRYNEAFEAGQWARQILEAHEAWQILAVLTMNLAVVHGRAGNDARSLDMFDQAAALYLKLGEEARPGWLLAQQNRAIALRNLGRFEESIQASQIAWDGLAGLGQKIEAARAQQNLAFTYFIQGRYNEALNHLEQVRDLFLADGRQRDAMLVELFISDCLLQLRRFEDVLEKCRQVESLFAELGTQRFVAQALVNEAVAYSELGNHLDALVSLSEARRIFVAEANQAWVASADLETAAVLLGLSRFSECLAVALESALVFEALSLPVEEAQARLVAARAALALGQKALARQLAHQALQTGRNRHVLTLTYQACYILGLLAQANDDPQAALANFDQAIEAVERLRGRLMVEFRVGFLEDKARIYEDMVSLCLELDQPWRGLEYAERAKSRALIDLLAYRIDLGVQARDAQDHPIVDQLIQLRADRDRLYRRWESDVEAGLRGWTSEDAERSQAQQEVLALEKQITDLWHRLLVHNADYARDAALWTVRAEPIQPYLKADDLLVEYFAVRNKLIVFLVSSTGIQVRRLACTLEQVNTLMQLLRLNLKVVPKSRPERIPALTLSAQGLLAQLYQHLIEPLAEQMDPFRRLVLVPHGPLHYLPFQALYNGGYLLEQFEISYLPSASFLRYCHETPSASTGLVTVGHSYGGRLPYTIQEARAVAARLDGYALLEEAATLDAFKQKAAHCGLVHVAAHGDFRSDNPLFSGLALADGWLTTLDIFNLTLRASLVTLSACQTGRNVVAGGDELLGLMRAFLSAGAASLVLTLWPVEDSSTAQLMELFYEGLAGNCPKGAALRQAQLQFLENQADRRYSHPYFWSPFFLVGDAGQL